MTKRVRIDRLLVERGLFESRAKAQEAIAAGMVTADGVAVTKAAEEISADAALRAAPAHPWVSRGGLKLTAALDHFGIEPAGRICLDVGASTGGFTQVLLARGARRVYAVDVGRGQLHATLRARPDVVAIEARISDGKGLLFADGASRANMYSGDAPHSLLTISTVMKRRQGRIG